MAELMERIEDDVRHTEVTILRSRTALQLRLSGWSMAYAGASSYVAARIEPLISQAIESNPMQIARLLSLLIGFAEHGGHERGGD